MVADDQNPLVRAMARFAAGDDAALGDVYDLASPKVFTFLLRMSRDRSLAEDLTQETFLRIHRARGLYRVGAEVLPWAYTIARRLFLDAMRVRRTEGHTTTSGSVDKNGEEQPEIGPEVRAQGPSAEELLADAELRRAVDDALSKIPESQASAFRLLKGEGLSVAEVALVMGTTKGAVKLRAHRAYQALRDLLGGRFLGLRMEAPVASVSAKSAHKGRERR
jgi:RNA polymerase sigma-70 factor (ECF subfamily)